MKNEQFFLEKNIKPCPNCKRLIIKDQGCNEFLNLFDKKNLIKSYFI